MLSLLRAINLFLSQYIPTTRKSYNLVLKQFIDYTGAARPLDRITPEHVMEYMQSVDARPAVKSIATYNRHLKTLRTFFNWCLRMGYLSASPAAGLRLRRQQHEIPRAKAMPDEDYEKLVEYVSAIEKVKEDPRGLALVLFLGDTGCRIGGATGLHWSDLKLEDRSATVTEKGKPPRPVFYGVECSNVLKRWRIYQRQAKGRYVFSATGARIQAANLSHYFRRLCIAAGIGSWGPHSLRHRKGYQLNDARISPSVGAAVLGDTVQIFLKHYSPRDESRIRAAIDELAYASEEPASKIRKLKTRRSS